jgi:hypothetical protein
MAFFLSQRHLKNTIRCNVDLKALNREERSTMYYVPNPRVESSKSHPRVIQESSESHPRVIRKSSKSHQKVIRHSSDNQSPDSHFYLCTSRYSALYYITMYVQNRNGMSSFIHQAVITQSSGSHQAVIKQSLGSHSYTLNIEWP